MFELRSPTEKLPKGKPADDSFATALVSSFWLEKPSIIVPFSEESILPMREPYLVTQ